MSTKPEWTEGKATMERNGCDRIGCTTTVHVGDTIRYLNGKAYCQTAVCTGLFTNQATKLGEAYARAVIGGEPLPTLDTYLNVPKARAAKPEDVNVAAVNLLASMSADDLAALIAKVKGADAPTSEAIGTGPVTSAGKARSRKA
jgi:hypothetical protein